MAEALNFIFLLVCIIILLIRLLIDGGRISKLEGKVDSLLISLKKAEGNNDKKK